MFAKRVVDPRIFQAFPFRYEPQPWTDEDNANVVKFVRVVIVINCHWLPSLPNAPGKDKLWEEASPAAATSRKPGWVTKLPT